MKELFNMREFFKYLTSRTKAYWVLVLISAVVIEIVLGHSWQSYVAGFLCGLLLRYLEI